MKEKSPFASFIKAHQLNATICDSYKANDYAFPKVTTSFHKVLDYTNLDFFQIAPKQFKNI